MTRDGHAPMCKLQNNFFLTKTSKHFKHDFATSKWFFTFPGSKKTMGNKLSLMLLLLLLSLVHAYSGESTVRYLPGFQGPLPFELETGYIGVGEAEEDQLFYYFIKSERNPSEDPFLIWLTGGPGCSSLSGLILENGPLAFNIESDSGNIPSLVSTTYSWTKVANIIYLDQPVGTGFSYSRNRLANIPSDTGSAKRVHEFVRNWLAKHPEYFSNPFYVAGNSYSGKVVPAVVQEISIESCTLVAPSLQGYVLGNPVTDYVGYNWRIPFAHGMGLISDEIYEVQLLRRFLLFITTKLTQYSYLQSLRRICRGNFAKVDPHNTECMNLVEEFEKCVSGLDWSYILGPKYINPSDPDDANPLGHRMIVQSNRWTNEESVRRALHVEKKGFLIDGNKTVKICRGLSENGHFVIGNYLSSLTLKAVYHTIRTTASKDIDLSSSVWHDVSGETVVITTWVFLSLQLKTG
ncbi:hypothetical protein YC2023_030056 [Brassica napus]